MDSSNEQKKKRAPNFSAKERYLLLNIIIKYKHIIENKKNDTTTWKEKDEAWKEIAQIFNSQTSENYHRPKESLRKYYDNIKKNVRKEVAKEKKEINATGGGVKRKIGNDETKELALSIMNRKTLYGFANPFDGDATISTENSCEVTVDETSILSCPENQGEDEIILKYSHPLKEIDVNIVTEPSTSGVCKEVAEHSYTAKERNEKIISEPSTSGICKNDWAKSSTLKLKQPPSNNMGQTWFRRRRPPLRSSSKLEEEYSDIANIKKEVYQFQHEQMKAEETREKELFNLKKKKLLLEIEIKELELENIKKTQK